MTQRLRTLDLREDPDCGLGAVVDPAMTFKALDLVLAGRVDVVHLNGLGPFFKAEDVAAVALFIADFLWRCRHAVVA